MARRADIAVYANHGGGFHLVAQLQIGSWKELDEWMAEVEGAEFTGIDEGEGIIYYESPAAEFMAIEID